MRDDSGETRDLEWPGQAPAQVRANGGGTARVLDLDPLLRLHAEHAAADLGFAIVGDPPAGVDVCFVGLDSVEQCRRCGSPHRTGLGSPGRAGRLPDSPGPLVVGYVGGPPVLAAAHAAHFCSDVVVRLQVSDGRATLVCPALTVVATVGPERQDEIPADLTVREADMLVLILAGRTTTEIAARLCLSPATVRTHCQSLLLKTGARNRRALRARCLRTSSVLPTVESDALSG